MLYPPTIQSGPVSDFVIVISVPHNDAFRRRFETGILKALWEKE